MPCPPAIKSLRFWPTQENPAHHHQRHHGGRDFHLRRLHLPRPVLPGAVGVLHGTHFSVAWKVENVRNPAIAIPGWPTVTVYGEEIPMSAEAMMMAIAERLDLPGFGPNGFGEGVPFTRPEHLYLKQVANLAFGEKEDGSDGVPEADDEEMRIFREARRHLPKSVTTKRPGKRLSATMKVCGAKRSIY
jgi:hypothetical protein